MKHFSTRLPEDLYAKTRVLAAMKQVSMNNLFIESLLHSIARWEEKHGILPTPPDESE